MSALSILIVEDEPDIALALKMRFSALGFQVLTAATGRTAVEAVAQNHPELVLLDISLPDGDGFWVIRQLKSRSDTALIPVVFLTAHVSMDDQQKAMECGAVAYITKPFACSEFIGLCLKLLEVTAGTTV